MRKTCSHWLSLWAAVLVATVAHATTRGSAPDRYERIRERNAFGLKPRETPATQEPPRQPLRKVILTGVTTLGGYKRALLKIEPLPGKAGEKEESVILTEGQREGDIEVVQIDERDGKVTLNNSGEVETITFEKEPPKLPGGRTAQLPGIPTPSTAVVPPPALPATPTPTGRPFSRQPRWPMNTTAVPATPPAPVDTSNPPTPTVPAPTNQSQPAAQELTPEEQAIIAAIQQQSAGSNPVPPNTIVPANPGATAPALSPPGFKQPQTTTPADSGVNQQPIMPQ
jgi:hypothetical protein